MDSNVACQPSLGKVRRSGSRTLKLLLAFLGNSLVVFTLNGPYRLSQEPRFSYPIVFLEGQGFRKLASLSIATVNVMATYDHGRNWCTDHSHGERGSGIWQIIVSAYGPVK